MRSIYIVYADVNHYAPKLVGRLAAKLRTKFERAATDLGATLARVTFGARHVCLVVIGDERVADRVDEFYSPEFNDVDSSWAGPDSATARQFLRL